MEMIWFWLFASLLLIHNAEEYAFINRLAEALSSRGFRVPVRRFRVALAVITLAGFALVPLKAAGLASADQLLAGAAVVMAINVFFPHVLLTAALRRYTAGVVSAVLLVAPTSILTLRAALHSGLTPSQIAVGTLAVGVPLIAFIWLFIGHGLTRDRDGTDAGGFPFS
ncbi:HXXEE domain-containing protein [Aerophototrophica crusticola]|uniref:HXXEE domain-containing protein n=1 Tax=Aerophototrophica crusticola TaxID=1709002 RepID=A0A858R9D6_9PROT|nr:HXXEE domain-containing protein [Rhodospirillaceae bacterium B3]